MPGIGLKNHYDFRNDMDDIDRKLLGLLRENGRASFTSLAQEVGTSEGTVRARMKRLVTEGIISQFTIKVAGNQVKALIEVVVERNTQTRDVAGLRVALHDHFDEGLDLVAGDLDGELADDALRYEALHARPDRAFAGADLLGQAGEGGPPVLAEQPQEFAVDIVHVVAEIVVVLESDARQRSLAGGRVGAP